MRYWQVLFICLLSSCVQKESQNSEITGEALAKSACASCHAYTDPKLLPKKQWESVLPRMGLRLGIESPEHDPFPGFTLEETQRVLEGNVFPDEPLLEDSLWFKLQQYFLTNAPDSLELRVSNNPAHKDLFKTIFPKLNLGGAPFVSMVKFIDDTVYLADVNGNLVRLDQNLKIQSFTGFPRPIIDLESRNNDTFYVLSIGDLYPNDRLAGGMASIEKDDLINQKLLIDKLARPVHFSVGDLDSDGNEDLVVCSFGNYVGDLSWYRNTGNGYEKRTIKAAPGATRSFLHDLDNDGDLDIIALFAQGDEGISVFINNNGEFRERRVLRFHPLFGSNDLELADMDADGDLDLVMSNGDNGDYSITLKPYHGIRIFLNDGALNFTESYFQPLYGSSKVRVNDFDLDGDMDIIAASFFPDNKSGIEQSICLMLNNGDLSFDVFSVEGADKGRWMVMDSGDIDQDGDIDVVLGSFTLAHEGIDTSIIDRWRSDQNYIMALINQTNP